MNHIAHSRARDIVEINAGISGIARILEEDMARRGCDDGAELLTADLEGCCVYAIKHLSERAGWLAEAIAGDVEVES